eukprot:7487336-Pyramimonas_sp.AAC.1
MFRRLTWMSLSPKSSKATSVGCRPFSKRRASGPRSRGVGDVRTGASVNPRACGLPLSRMRVPIPPACPPMAASDSLAFDGKYVETFNGSGWRSLKERLVTTSSVIACAQEIGLSELSAAQSLDAVRALGWKFLISASEFNPDTNRCSAGVAVFARSGLGPRWTD